MFRELPTAAESEPRGRRLTSNRHPASRGGLAGRLFRSALPRLILVTLTASSCLCGGLPLGFPASLATASEPGNHPPAAKPAVTKSGSSRTSSSRLFSEVTRTSVFGLEGQGNTFVYLFDRSGSMSDFEGRPLAAAKAELLKSLQLLRGTNQFQIVFYNHELASFNPYHPQPPRLMFGDDRTKEQAEQFVRQIRATGGTRHVEPLKLALRLAPDVIFFLTDAAEPELTGQQLEELARLNRGTVIQAIEFGVGPATGRDNFMLKLARQTGGRYVYVDVTQLPNR